jgi:hypothetical protein
MKMAPLAFPTNPTLNQVYPAGAGTPGVSQWKWDGAKWETITPFLRTNNQLAENTYTWPNSIGINGLRLTRGVGTSLTWEDPATANTFVILKLAEAFNGVRADFTLQRADTSATFTPTPATNIFVSIGGVAQIYGSSYLVVGSTISFYEAPATGATFYALTSA